MREEKKNWKPNTKLKHTEERERDTWGVTSESLTVKRH